MVEDTLLLERSASRAEGLRLILEKEQFDIAHIQTFETNRTTASDTYES